MHKSVLAGEDVHECAEVHDAADLAGEYVADLDLAGQVVNHLHGFLRRRAVSRANNDRAVFLYVNGGAGLFGDAAYGLASGAYHRANLVHGDADLQHSRGKRAEVFARVAYRLAHVVENEKPGFLSLLQRVLNDVEADAVHLDVELNGGYALARASDFEVHVANMVFHALNVGDGGIFAVFTVNKADGDAGDGCLDRHAGVHER